ncbi:MAG: type II secretion system F family protein [Gammaproteobacteria bacterium]|nr:MAG: type II secretion system F family protein [Gammaproteobacteria bacterium]RLA21157.1 MAG: type II secretion system F family protein [Gammaproteobacteria bacterium]
MATKTLELTLYAWEGTDKKGNRIKGEQTAKSETIVKTELRRQGIKPIKVKKKSKPLFSKRTKAITTKDISIFSRQLATMMSAGVPLVQAFDIVGRGHENPAMQDLILGIKSDVEGGTALAEALSKQPLYFDELFCNLVNAGEQAGILETLLHKIAEYKEKTEALKAKIKKAMSYPIAVLVVAFVVTAILLIFVVPTFEDLFQSFGADLPAFTQMVIDMSRFIQEWWWAIFGSIGIAIFVGINAKKRSVAFQHFLDRSLLKLPVIGVILNKAAIARFARTLGTMSAAGVPLVEALTSVAGAAGNIIYFDAILKMREEVSSGTQLQQAMRQADLFPNMVVQMVAIGEESGSLDAMLSKVADFYEEEVDNAVDSLTSLLEPMIMAFLGVVIGGLVIAMYLPIFKMGAVV